MAQNTSFHVQRLLNLQNGTSQSNFNFTILVKWKNLTLTLLLLIGTLSPGYCTTKSQFMKDAEKLIERGSQEEALNKLHEELQVNPRNGKAYYQIGKIYKDIGNFDKMIAAYDSSLKITKHFKSEISSDKSKYDFMKLINGKRVCLFPIYCSSEDRESNAFSLFFSDYLFTFLKTRTYFDSTTVILSVSQTDSILKCNNINIGSFYKRPKNINLYKDPNSDKEWLKEITDTAIGENVAAMLKNSADIILLCIISNYNDVTPKTQELQGVTTAVISGLLGGGAIITELNVIDMQVLICSNGDLLLAETSKTMHFEDESASGLETIHNRFSSWICRTLLF